MIDELEPQTDQTSDGDPQGISAELLLIDAMEADAVAVPACLPSSALEELDLFQSRECLSEYHVGQLVRALSLADSLAPLLVLRRGGRFLLVDGRHRRVAYERAGRGDAIPVVQFMGSPADAILEGQRLNGINTLVMTPDERMDGGWKLVKLARYTTKEIMAAAIVSRAQVGIMRRALRDLGAEAADHDRWKKALRAHQGQAATDYSEEEIEMMIDAQAARVADLMVRKLGMQPADKPEMLARALEIYTGRRLPALMRELQERNGGEGEFGNDMPF
ncbi:MAG: nuclease [Devosia sp.]